MKSEAADYLGKARQCLDDAQQIAAATSLYHIVAHEAYLAAFHAVEAYLFERTGKAAKTQGGEDASRLAQRIQPAGARRSAHRPGVPDLPYRSLRVQTDRGLRVGRSLHSITAESARSAIDTAARLIDCIATLVA